MTIRVNLILVAQYLLFSEVCISSYDNQIDKHKIAIVLDTIKTLLSSFFEICLLRRNPQDMPASRFLLLASLSALMILGLALSLVSLPLKDAVISTALNLAVLIIITQLVLILYKKHARYTQTLTAMAGTGIVISVFAIPVIVMLEYSRQNEINPAPVAVLWLLLMSWEVVVMAHILRHALSCHIVLALMLAVLYPWAYFQLVGLFVPLT